MSRYVLEMKRMLVPVYLSPLRTGQVGFNVLNGRVIDTFQRTRRAVETT
jgi:hypothetical protein